MAIVYEYLAEYLIQSFRWINARSVHNLPEALRPALNMIEIPVRLPWSTTVAG